MRLTIIESPFAAATAELLDRNARYLDACLRDSLNRHEAPYASHAYLPRVLDDTIPAERALGIAAGLEWGRCAALSAVYVDIGVSRGMLHGITSARAHGRPIEVRRLPDLALDEALGIREAQRARVEHRDAHDRLVAIMTTRRPSCPWCSGMRSEPRASTTTPCSRCGGRGEL